MKGHALLSTLIVALLINIILTGVLLSYLNSISFYQVIERKEIARTNLFSGINILLADTTVSPKMYNTTIDFTGNSNDSVNIKKELWGILWLGLVKGYSKSERNDAVFFYGPSPEESTALILADHQRPLNITGTSFINGNVALPKAGIHAASVAGKRFEGRQLFYGNKRISTENDFYEDSTILKELKSLMDKTRSIENSTRSTELNGNHSFFSDTIIYTFLPRESRLQNCIFKGKIILLCDSIIEIDRSCSIEDCIVVAPEVRIKQGFSGNLQVLASKTIEIEPGANLKYPSSLILLNNEEENYPGKVIMKPNSNVEGIIALFGKETGVKPIFLLDRQSVFMGTCYVKGFSEIKGTLIGMLATDYVIFRSEFATYENTLVDAKIDRRALSKFFAGSSLLRPKSSLKIIKWLD